MVCNVRGTSGSGKTTLVRDIMALGQVLPLGDNPKKPVAYQLSIPSYSPIFVLGSYENVCGGMDGVKTQEEICDRIRQFAPLGHVLVEGLLMSTLFSKYVSLDRELLAQGVPTIWAFLDTPLDVCLDRVRARREARGTVTPLNTKNTTDKWHLMRHIYNKCTLPDVKDWKKISYPPAVLDARWVDYTKAAETVSEWLR